MYFFFVATILAFAFSVNAASVNKRVDIGIPAQTCITSLVSLNQALGDLDVAANNITASAGYAGMLMVHAIEQTVETNITAAGTSCCSITSTLTGSDATAVLAEESTVANSYGSVFNGFTNALPEIQKVLLYAGLMKADFISIYNKSVPLLDCLTSMMPSDSTSTAQGYATNIENNIQKAITKFNQTTTTATTSTATATTTTIISTVSTATPTTTTATTATKTTVTTTTAMTTPATTVTTTTTTTTATTTTTTTSAISTSTPSATAQTCINRLASLNQALGALDVAANNISASAGYAGMLMVHAIEQTVETNITAAGTSCCSITSTLTGSDATAVLAEESTVANSYGSVFNGFTNALPEIQKVLLYAGLMKADFVNIYNKTVPLLDCLTSMMPSDSTSTAQGYATNIENNIQKAILKFNTTITTTAVATPTS